MNDWISLYGKWRWDCGKVGITAVSQLPFFDPELRLWECACSPVSMWVSSRFSLTSKVNLLLYIVARCDVASERVCVGPAIASYIVRQQQNWSIWSPTDPIATSGSIPQCKISPLIFRIWCGIDWVAMSLWVCTGPWWIILHNWFIPP